MSPGAMASRTPAKVAIGVRTHLGDEKTWDLIRSVRDAERFDLYVLADQTNGPLNTLGSPTIDASLQSVRSLGFSPDHRFFLVHLSDLLFSVFMQAAPGYDQYVMIDYDVQMAEAGALTMLADGLNGDLVGPRWGPRGPQWMWHSAAARMFTDVWGVFFPLVSLSPAAIQHLLERRRHEERKPLGPRLYDRVNCEAFTASALAAAGSRCCDLNDILPGAHTREGFNLGPPQRLGAVAPAAGMFRHPVLAGEDYEGKLARWREVHETAQEPVGAP